MDNCYSTNVVGLTDEFFNLERLSLIKVGLTNLKNFPNLPNLTRVSEIFFLEIRSLLRVQFSRAILNGHCTSQAVEDSHIFNSVFSQLELGENRIMSGLQSLQGSPKLAHLSLSNNRIKDLETLEPLVSTKFELSFVCESHPIQGRSTMLSDLRLKMKLLYFAVGWLVIFYYR